MTVSSGPSYRILLAEDNSINQRVVMQMLTKRGHSVELAQNGLEALERLQAESFDVVLMDVQMPQMGGVEATQLIRDQEAKTGVHLPIIALTAHAMKGDREQFMNVGMDDYVSKPIDAELLFEKITKLIRKHTNNSGHDSHSESRREEMDDHKAPVFDYAAALARLGGDEEFFWELAEMFQEQAPQWMKAIKTAIEEKDCQTLHKSAHTLKGAVSNFAAPRVVEAAQELESLGKQELLENADHAYRALDVAVAELTEAWREQRVPVR